MIQYIKFEDTILYDALSDLFKKYNRQCLYLKILTFPLYIGWLLVTILFGVVFDFFYFSFSDQHGENNGPKF